MSFKLDHMELETDVDVGVDAGYYLDLISFDANELMRSLGDDLPVGELHTKLLAEIIDSVERVKQDLDL